MTQPAGFAYLIAEPTDDGRLRLIRPLNPHESQFAGSAIDLIQNYGRPVAYEQLLIARDRVFEQFRSGLDHLRRRDTEAATWEFEIAFATWLLYWRLYLDQTEADLLRRFGEHSTEVEQFSSTCSGAFDSSSAYRIVEGLRNMVAHSRRIRTRPIFMPVLGTDFHSYHLMPSELLREFAFRHFAKADLKALEGAHGGGILPVDGLVNESMGALARVARSISMLETPGLQSAAVYLAELTEGCAPDRVVVAGDVEDGFVLRAWTRTPEPVRLLIQELGRIDHVRQYGTVTLDGLTSSPGVGNRVMVNLSRDGLHRARDEQYIAERMDEMNGQIGTVVRPFGTSPQEPALAIALSFDPYPRSWKSEDLLDATYAQVALGLRLER